ncbi:hypothetical protein PN36_14220 [Candidatus Thiomargarita nelsonii]|uniref:Uncharacterized protein n=1 Tax=Candidatus Thiomargarita nelsonii TaxID=1003181 RepID=A0A0A6P439_9GAMM|nr:hypothetical protein PN36_14220 [Candidatus Thiomargarita nelsonii]
MTQGLIFVNKKVFLRGSPAGIIPKAQVVPVLRQLQKINIPKMAENSYDKMYHFNPPFKMKECLF